MSNNYPGMMVVGFLLLTLCCSALAEPGASTFSRTAAQGIMSPMRFSALLPTIHTPAAVTSQEAHDTLRRILARREFEQYRDKPLTKDNKGFLAQFFAKAGEAIKRLICRACHHVVEFEDCDLLLLEKLLAAKTGYTIQGHHLELYGTCPACIGQ